MRTIQEVVRELVRNCDEDHSLIEIGDASGVAVCHGDEPTHVRGDIEEEIVSAFYSWLNERGITTL